MSLYTPVDNMSQFAPVVPIHTSCPKKPLLMVLHKLTDKLTTFCTRVTTTDNTTTPPTCFKILSVRPSVHPLVARPNAWLALWPGWPSGLADPQAWLALSLAGPQTRLVGLQSRLAGPQAGLADPEAWLTGLRPGWLAWGQACWPWGQAVLPWGQAVLPWGLACWPWGQVCLVLGGRTDIQTDRHREFFRNSSPIGTAAQKPANNLQPTTVSA